MPVDMTLRPSLSAEVVKLDAQDLAHKHTLEASYRCNECKRPGTGYPLIVEDVIKLHVSSDVRRHGVVAEYDRTHACVGSSYPFRPRSRLLCMADLAMSRRARKIVP